MSLPEVIDTNPKYYLYQDGKAVKCDADKERLCSILNRMGDILMMDLLGCRRVFKECVGEQLRIVSLPYNEPVVHERLEHMLEVSPHHPCDFSRNNGV
jgi:hypothetical protein